MPTQARCGDNKSALTTESILRLIEVDEHDDSLALGRLRRYGVSYAGLPTSNPTSPQGALLSWSKCKRILNVGDFGNTFTQLRD